MKRIFVTGTMHSGTTLLLRAFRKHPQVLAPLSETKFFQWRDLIEAQFPDLGVAQIRTDYQQYLAEGLLRGFTLHKGFLGIGDRRYDLDLLSNLAQVINATEINHAQIFIDTFDRFAALSGKQAWVEKTPPHIFYADDILQVAPDALFVFTVRDPRDTLASKRQRRLAILESEISEKTLAKRLEKAYDPVWDTLSWRSTVRAARQVQNEHPSQIHILSYEDLVSDPKKQLIDLCAFAGLSFDENILRVNKRNSAYRDENQRGITTGSVDRWKQSLPIADQVICQHLARKDMWALNYAVVSLPVRYYFQAFFRCLLSLYEFMDRLRRRYLYGGKRYLLNVLQGYRRRFQRMH